MNQTMRWYGPNDPVSLSDIRQAGCQGVVSALHHIPNGEIWTLDEIQKRKKIIENEGLEWNVVESLPVHEAIKTQTEGFQIYIDNYKISLQNLAHAGIKVITYNFMPILDWTRTNLSYSFEDGSKALHFDTAEIVAFDMFILKRPNAGNDYTEDEIIRGQNIFDTYSDEQKLQLQNNIIAGLPGSEESFTLKEFQKALDNYQNIDIQKLQKHLIHFLNAITPLCDDLNLLLALHPDDPPYPIFGLPRIVSTATQIQVLFDSVPNKSNGICLCTGSLGVRLDNNIGKMIEQFANRINFLHLRNIRSSQYNNFTESNHLEGNINMYDIVERVFHIMQKQQRSIPMRPDHGHQMLDDLKKKINPGYSAIGRLRGLAELRGLEYGISNNWKKDNI
ncbi:mannonate dehydratase [Rhizosphaericola mali]|nr:mannonate dehydratase [Rhizosphaericola mali]